MKIRPVGHEVFQAGGQTGRWTDGKKYDIASSRFSQACEKRLKSKVERDRGRQREREREREREW